MKEGSIQRGRVTLNFQKVDQSSEELENQQQISSSLNKVSKSVFIQPKPLKKVKLKGIKDRTAIAKSITLESTNA